MRGSGKLLTRRLIAYTRIPILSPTEHTYDYANLREWLRPCWGRPFPPGLFLSWSVCHLLHLGDFIVYIEGEGIGFNGVFQIDFGCARHDSATINANNTKVTVTGRSSNLASLAGRTLPIRFYGKNAKFYAFQFQ